MGSQVKFSPWLVGTLLLAGLSVFFAGSLARQVTGSRPLPLPPMPGATQAAPPAGQASPTAGTDDLAAYNVIVAKHLFNPSRSEATPAPTPVAAVPPQAKPVLHGLVVDGMGSLAFLEDPTSKRTLGYRVGDSVAGGQLVQISSDRVLIRRTDGQLDVLLNDPTKVRIPVEAAAPPSPKGRARAPRPDGQPQAPVRTPRSGQTDQPPVEQHQPGIAAPPEDSDN